jgi:ankyrin repeat protein
VRFLSKRGAALEIRNLAGETPLHTAVGAASTSATRLLLDLGSDPNAQNALGRTALHIALCREPNPAILRELLSAGADLQSRDLEGKTPRDVCESFEYHMLYALLKPTPVDPTTGPQDEVRGR